VSMSKTKEEIAGALGYGDDVAAMDMEHDVLHGALCHFLSIPSFSLKEARGEPLTRDEQKLARFEEAAVLAAQKLRQMHRILNYDVSSTG
jgi:hypothetical protein